LREKHGPEQQRKATTKHGTRQQVAEDLVQGQFDLLHGWTPSTSFGICTDFTNVSSDGAETGTAQWVTLKFGWMANCCSVETDLPEGVLLGEWQR
jgi:hypothetical protein